MTFVGAFERAPDTADARAIAGRAGFDGKCHTVAPMILATVQTPEIQLQRGGEGGAKA